ncbi:C4-dicarboxylate transporter DcuC [Anaerosinus massiliensis]|uniref:C4-dicarboxylate transporter DcuC n=1 Tax=Massilibacillus massiliensis TaxID=1806837 RepID=UPI000A72F8A0|nr:C4-dicarboxylate transporter DcuC [Massilibacillus massiliensis]
MVLSGAIIVILTLIAIAKRYETRMVLFAAGFLMAIIGGNPLGAMTAFEKTMVNSGLVTTICSVMGFSFVMKYTKCDANLVQLLANGLDKCKFILVPGAVLITWVLNIALSSTAGTCAAVGAVLIPTMIRSGVHPAMAGACILTACISNPLNPGFPHAIFVANLANVDVMEVIYGYTLPLLIVSAIVLSVMTIQSVVRKEGVDPLRAQAANVESNTSEMKISLIKASIPVIPLIILVLATPQVGVLPKISIPQAMIIGTLLGFIVHRKNPQDITKEFFNGLGNAYSNIIGIIIAAGVFTYGMGSIGLTSALVDLMKNSQDLAKYAACIGPALIAVISGSGDAAALAFNGAVTPHAAQFGMTITDLGSLSTLSGTLGRAMSPVAGGTIICATLAGVNPIEIAKRTAPGLIISLVALFILL